MLNARCSVLNSWKAKWCKILVTKLSFIQRIRRQGQVIRASRSTKSSHGQRILGTLPEIKINQNLIWLDIRKLAQQDGWKTEDERITKKMSRETGNAQCRATFFRHFAVLSLPTVLVPVGKLTQGQKQGRREKTMIG